MARTCDSGPYLVARTTLPAQLDHISFGVAEHADLDAWASWLDELGIEHSGVIDTDNPIPYSVVVFRDPDNIQLELCYIPG